MLFARNTSPSVQKKLTTSTDGTLLGPAGGHVRRLAPFTLQEESNTSIQREHLHSAGYTSALSIQREHLHSAGYTSARCVLVFESTVICQTRRPFLTVPNFGRTMTDVAMADTRVVNAYDAAVRDVNIAACQAEMLKQGLTIDRLIPNAQPKKKKASPKKKKKTAPPPRQVAPRAGKKAAAAPSQSKKGKKRGRDEDAANAARTTMQNMGSRRCTATAGASRSLHGHANPLSHLALCLCLPTPPSHS